MLSGAEVWPLVEGGKGISVSTGATCGAWARAGAVGTFSAVNADFFSEAGKLMAPVSPGKTWGERYRELIAQAIKGGVSQASIAHETSCGQGRIHMNVLWEMAGTEEILHGIFSRAKELIHGLTCGAGMPYKAAEIAAGYGISCYPIVSSVRAFRALYKRAYHKFCEFLGGVVYEDPWYAGGHNGFSHQEDVHCPEHPYARVVALRSFLRECGLGTVPIIIAGGVWWLSEWVDWIDNPEVGPVAFQFGTRPLLTQESPVARAWQALLFSLKKGDVLSMPYSPTGFFSSAVNNAFLQELRDRSTRQISCQDNASPPYDIYFPLENGGEGVYMDASGQDQVHNWRAAGYTVPLRTPEKTLLFVTPQKAEAIRRDQTSCVGCLSACRFSGWCQTQQGAIREGDPRSFCIQKTLQRAAHGGDPSEELIFSGTQAYRFAEDPYYANGFIPTVRQLVERLLTGY
ncbi:MAG: nitronate monooxygenase [Holosporales bacterium]|nr:nitronate monooxygenase [Holosporales bacterium]